MAAFLMTTMTNAQGASGQAAGSLYDLQTTTLDGKPAPLAAYKGKVTLVVNTASQCGYTPQYAGLQKLHDEMKGKGFSVLGFPSNDFGGQEPGAAEEIATFCQRNYGVTFPMFSKLVTKAGPGPVADLRLPRRHAATSRAGTSRSTSSARTAR